MSSPDLETKDLLNAQTGKIKWNELARHFTRGVVVCVAPGQDLVQITEFRFPAPATALRKAAALNGFFG